MRIAAHLTMQDDIPRCPRCKGPGGEVLRREWGCDTPAPAPLFSITCPRCSGHDPECEECDGSGDKPILRCPASQLTPDVYALMQAVNHYDSGHLPSVGGMSDQAATFVLGLEAYKAEQGRIREEQRKDRERAAKADARKNQGGGARR